MLPDSPESSSSSSSSGAKGRLKIECVGVGANIEVVPLDVVVVVVVVVLREKVGLFLARDVKSKDGRFWKSFFAEMKLLTGVK